MSLWAIGIGIALGVAILVCALRQRIVQTSTFLLVTLAAIALFYPAFELFGGSHDHKTKVDSFFDL